MILVLKTSTKWISLSVVIKCKNSEKVVTMLRFQQNFLNELFQKVSNFWVISFPRIWFLQIEVWLSYTLMKTQLLLANKKDKHTAPNDLAIHQTYYIIINPYQPINCFIPKSRLYLHPFSSHQITFPGKHSQAQKIYTF